MRNEKVSWKVDMLISTAPSELSIAHCLLPIDSRSPLCQQQWPSPPLACFFQPMYSGRKNGRAGWGSCNSIYFHTGNTPPSEKHPVRARVLAAPMPGSCTDLLQELLRGCCLLLKNRCSYWWRSNFFCCFRRSAGIQQGHHHATCHQKK